MYQWIVSLVLLIIICSNIKIITCDENCTNSLTYKLPICPPGYTLANGLCYLSGHVPMTSCPMGYQLYNNSFCYPLASVPCMPYIAPVLSRNPPPDTVDESQPRCPPGSVFLQEECRKLVCSQGEYYRGRCLQAACPDGMVWRGRRCQDPEYVTTILEIENVFVDEKDNAVERQHNFGEIDVMLVTGSPLAPNSNIKTYFNKTQIIGGNKIDSGGLDIEINTQAPFQNAIYTEKHIKTYFNKTDIKDPRIIEKEIELSESQNLKTQVNIEEPNTLALNENIKTYFEKKILSTGDDNLNKIVLSSPKIDIKNDDEIGSGDLDANIIIGKPQYQNDDAKTEKLADTTTVQPPPSTSTEAIIVPDNATVCCTVYTPRICKLLGKRWMCFNRFYKLCDYKVCTHEVIYLKSPEIAYKSPLLIMPPNPPLPACAENNCDATTNCSGCISYQRETCSSYCFRYLCAKDSCAYMDQQLFCAYYAGQFGCIERDGCIWSWCGVQNVKQTQE